MLNVVLQRITMLSKNVFDMKRNNHRKYLDRKPRAELWQPLLNCNLYGF